MTTLLLLRESTPSERRVAVVPADVARLSALGLDVMVEAGAGDRAGYPDSAYLDAGAKLAPGSGSEEPAVVAKVRPPTPEEAARLPVRSILVCFLPPGAELATVGALRGRQATVLSFDLVPRISRAQTLDALSSQAGAAGYQAAVLAADRLGRMMPMLMTAAGTVPPARVLVLGAGVAGLQAIATSKRLGASVSAYDIRAAAAEEVRSLGARFVELPIEAVEGSGGYAAEQSEEFIARQQELVASAVAESDVVITTAAVPGRPAPKLVLEAMVDRMRPGSLIVDLAAASGGNCVLTRDGEDVEHGGVTIIGAGNLASDVATSASALYSRNVSNVLQLLGASGDWAVDLADEVLAGMCLMLDGDIRHEPTRLAFEGEQS